MRVLSIDAWRDDGGWIWNQWFLVGSIDKDKLETLTTNRKIIKWFRDNEYISKDSKGKVSVYDDGYNIVLLVKSTLKPLYAIEYGNTYEF